MKEQEILDFLSHAETGALTDAMNLLRLDGWMEGIFPLPPDIRICGKAFTVQYERQPGPGAAILNVFEIMELADKGSVMVCSVPSRDAIVGENIMHATKACALAGMVLDGVARDSGVIRREQLPLFCRASASAWRLPAGSPPYSNPFAAEAFWCGRGTTSSAIATA